MKKSILFNLDGTLTDSRVGVTRSIQFALDHLDVSAPAASELEWCIGPPLLDSFQKLLGSARDKAAEALELYHQRYMAEGMFENLPYSGISEALDGLVAHGHDLYVATSTPTKFAETILENVGLSRFFKGIHASKLDCTQSDKGDLIRHILRVLDIAPETAVMVGDRGHDMIGAAKNGVSAVGVTYGYGSREELRAAGAEFLVESPLQLLSVLAADFDVSLLEDNLQKSIEDRVLTHDAALEVAHEFERAGRSLRGELSDAIR